MTRKTFVYNVQVAIVAVLILLPFVNIRSAKALTITALSVGSLTTSSATISWTTDVAGDSVVEYGISGTVTDVQEVDEMKTTHAIVLSGLAAGTQYTFIASSADANGEVSYAAEGSFTTAGVAVTPPPSATPPPASPPPAVTPPPVVIHSPAVSVVAYPTGTLVNEKGTVYFLMKKDKVKIPFSSADAFLGLGYKWTNVKTLDISGYRKASTYVISSAKQAHPWGSCLVWKDGTVFYSTRDGLSGIPTMQIAESIGCSFDKIVPLNDADDEVWLKNPKLPVIQMNDVRMM